MVRRSLLKSQVGALQHVDLGGPQTLPLGNEEDNAIALVLKSPQRAVQFRCG